MLAWLEGGAGALQFARIATAACAPSSLPADGRHLDTYDTHAAQYWGALQRFISGLQPAEPLPALPPPPPPNPTAAPAVQLAPQRHEAEGEAEARKDQ